MSISKYAQIADLIACDKWGFSNGEKKTFSGWLNRWIKTYNQDGVVKEVFLYYQPVTYYFNMLHDRYQRLSKAKQTQLCIKFGYYSLPFTTYNQRLTAWEIRTFDRIGWDNEGALSMLSGDDDIIDITFPLEDWSKVKSYIQDNYKTLSYQSLYDWVKSNKYSFR
jgi:hypothetical protein